MNWVRHGSSRTFETGITLLDLSKLIKCAIYVGTISCHQYHGIWDRFCNISFTTA